MNMITAEKRVAATRLVRSGRTVSLSRYFPKTRGPGNVNPAQHYMFTASRGSGGGAMDYYGISYHGRAATHIDALCHVWDENGMWNGRDPHQEITFDGAKWGSIDVWEGGIFTRGVLLDIPKLRGEPYVTQDSPVHGWDLEAAAKAQGVTIEPGDAVADIGAGTGYFTVRLAGSTGARTVYAVDIESSMVDYVRDRAADARLGKVVAVLADAAGTNLPEPVDVALIVNTFHHIPDRVAYFSALRALMTPGARLAIVDYRKGASGGGPPDEFRFTTDEITAELSRAGLELVTTHDFLPRQSFLIYGVS